MADNRVGMYIHYRYENYRAYGLSMRGRGTPPSPSLEFQKQRQRLLDTLGSAPDPSQKIMLERQLNFFFDPTKKSIIDLGYSEQDASQIQQKIISLCEEAVGNLVNMAADINWGTLGTTKINNLSATKDLQKEFQLVKKTSLGRDGQKFTTQDAIARRLKAFFDLRDQLAVEVKKGKVDQYFLTKINQFESQYDTIIKDLVANVDGENVQTAAGKTHKRFNLEGQNAAFVDELQTLVDETRRFTTQYVNGLLAEYIPIITQQVYSQLVNNTLDKVLDMAFTPELLGGHVGNTRSRKGLLSTKVITKAGTAINQHTEAIIGDIKAKFGSTQNKVDIQLTLPDSTKVNASVKNIKKGDKNFNVLNGTSILEFLQNYETFTNHYLNITACHPYEVGLTSGLLQQAHDTAKLTIALHALTGGSWGESAAYKGTFTKDAQADMLIVNQRGATTGQFKVYYMQDILKRLSDNLNLIDVSGFNHVRRWHNEWIGGPTPDYVKGFRRIADLLKQLHIQKLKVQLSTRALS